MRSPLSSPQFANVTALLALVVATAGASYAAVTLPKNSVGTPQLQKNAVVSKKVKNGSLKAKDFAAGQLPRGEQGPPGVKGADGTAVAYAFIAADGTVAADRSKGIVQANVAHPATGRYCISGLSFAPKNAVATVDGASAGAPSPIISAGLNTSVNGCPLGTQIAVFTTRVSDSNFVEQAFYLLVN